MLHRQVAEVNRNWRNFWFVKKKRKSNRKPPVFIISPSTLSKCYSRNLALILRLSFHVHSTSSCNSDGNLYTIATRKKQDGSAKQKIWLIQNHFNILRIIRMKPDFFSDNLLPRRPTNYLVFPETLAIFSAAGTVVCLALIFEPRSRQTARS